MPLPEKPPVIAARASNTGDDVFAVHRVLGEFRDSDTEATFRDSRLANDKSVAVIVMMASCAVFLFMSGVDYYTFREGAPAALPRVLVARLVCCVGTVACIVSVLRARRYTTLLRVSPLFVACVILPYSYIALAYATHSQGSVNMNVYLIVGALSPLLFQIPMRFALQGSLIIFVAAVCNHVFFIGTPIGSVVILISSMVASMALSASLAHGIQCGRRREYAGTRRVEALAESLRAEVERRKLTEQELQEHRENLESLVETQAEKLRESERKLQMAQRLDSVGQLAGGIAHDFNNLLMVMLGSTEMALSHPDLPPECHDDLDEARRAAQQGSQLTRQLLAFSSRQTVTPETLDVNEVARSLEKMLRRVIPESIAVSFDLEEDLDSVVADHGQLEQVIMNLIVNARDAMPDGGRVLLTTRAVQLDSLEEMRNPNAKRCSYVLLSVSDTGQGIPKDYLERIFEPFFSTKEHGKGTGLGLAVVFGIANQHGGFVDVDSELGVGSEFRIYLPSVKKRRVEPAHEESAEQKVGTERILLAEDEEQVRALASRILTNAGYKVHAVGDGEAAVREVRAATERFDLIVLDLIMPKMNGDQAFEAIRAEDRDIPIMFCTGYSDASINTELVLGSGSQILRKPYSMKEILTAVRRAVDGSPDTASQADV